MVVGTTAVLFVGCFVLSPISISAISSMRGGGRGLPGSGANGQGPKFIKPHLIIPSKDAGTYEKESTNKFLDVDIVVIAIEPPKCNGKDVTMSQEDITAMMNCIKDIGGGSSFNDIPKEKLPCVGKCILQKRGLMDDTGMPQKENVIKMINSTMPAELLPVLDERIGKCIDDNGSIDTKDPMCTSYKPLTECVTKAVMEACKS